MPPELIAQHPLPERDQSRLLVLRRRFNAIEHLKVADLPNLLDGGDLLVFNNSKVIPARLHARKRGSGGSVEIMLVEEQEKNWWWAMVRPGKRVRPGTELNVLRRDGQVSTITIVVLEKSVEGHCLVKFQGIANILERLAEYGEMPLPPYIERGESGATGEDDARYQTVFAKEQGSVAAPTAGLHFTSRLLERLGERGINTAEVTLHVGLGTFAPVKADRLEEHQMHQERFELRAAAAELISETKRAGKRVVAVGTTTLRVLESVALQNNGEITATSGKTRLFVYPPWKFQVVDALLTNFHLPKSTLLMLVSAFAAPGSTAGRELAGHAYEEAIRERYRFFSYGDAMLLV